MLPITIIIILGSLYIVFDILNSITHDFRCTKKAIVRLITITIYLHIAIFIFKQVDAYLFIKQYAKQENTTLINAKIAQHQLLYNLL